MSGHKLTEKEMQQTQILIDTCDILVSALERIERGSCKCECRKTARVALVNAANTIRRSVDEEQKPGGDSRGNGDVRRITDGADELSMLGNSQKGVRESG